MGNYIEVHTIRKICYEKVIERISGNKPAISRCVETDLTSSVRFIARRTYSPYSVNDLLKKMTCVVTKKGSEL